MRFISEAKPFFRLKLLKKQISQVLGLRLEDCRLLLYFWKLIPKRFGQDNRKYGLQKKTKQKKTTKPEKLKAFSDYWSKKLCTVYKKSIDKWLLHLRCRSLVFNFKTGYLFTDRVSFSFGSSWYHFYLFLFATVLLLCQTFT